MSGNQVGTLLILGASGDLTARLLLPGFGDLLSCPKGRAVRLIGAGMEDWDQAKWVDRVKTAFDSADAKGPVVDQVVAGTSYQQADVTKAEDLKRLLDACDGAPAIYFALPPSITAKACAALQSLTLPAGTTLALEKPFGTDEKSATALNTLLAGLVPEDQVHRIDHFLGKSDVLNILGVRFANRLFENLWNSDQVERIDIVFDEELALEGRAGYYDGAGALVDMIQSHLLQVMAVLCMEPPSSIAAVDLRDSKAQVLRATEIWQGDAVASAKRARYTAGKIDGKDIPSYVDEKGVHPDRGTETLARVTVEIKTWRWGGVPVTLQSGKAIGHGRKEAIVTFKPVPHLPTGLQGSSTPTRLRFGFGPDNLTLEIDVNGPGDWFTLDRASLVADFGGGELPAYGQVLHGVLDGDSSMSVRADTAVDCWRVIAPVLAAFADGSVPIEDYAAGTEGPADWSELP